MNNSHKSFFHGNEHRIYRKMVCAPFLRNASFLFISDVDKAFSGTNMESLELLIKRIAQTTKWVLLQKLWYDVQNCCYYVLRNAKSDTLLAIDFLIDNYCIGSYGFHTKAITTACVLLNVRFPVPKTKTAFCYKLVKRIVKQRAVEENETYLIAQYTAANLKKVNQILSHQFGEKGSLAWQMTPYIRPYAKMR